VPGLPQVQSDTHLHELCGKSAPAIQALQEDEQPNVLHRNPGQVQRLLQQHFDTGIARPYRVLQTRPLRAELHHAESDGRGLVGRIKGNPFLREATAQDQEPDGEEVP
jgi:hypothetical protein